MKQLLPSPVSQRWGTELCQISEGHASLGRSPSLCGTVVPDLNTESMPNFDIFDPFKIRGGVEWNKLLANGKKDYLLVTVHNEFVTLYNTSFQNYQDMDEDVLLFLFRPCGDYCRWPYAMHYVKSGSTVGTDLVFCAREDRGILQSL